MSIGTVSLITQAATYSTTTAANGSGMWFQAQSGSYSQPNFFYRFDLFQKDITTGAIIQSFPQYVEPPRPFDPNSGLIGTGLFNPINALRSLIDNDPDWPITIQGIVPVTQSYVRYGIDYGFSYNPGLTFSTQSFVGQFLQLDFANAVDIAVGDQVTINMITTLFNPQYNQTTPIAAVSGGLTAAVTLIPYGITPSSVELGQITNLIRIVGTSSHDYYGWNGTRQYQEGGGNYADFESEFVLQGNSQNQFLTDYFNSPFFGPGSPTFSMKPVFLNQYETIGFLSDNTIGSHTAINRINIITFDQLGNQLTNNTFVATMSYPSRKYELGVGPQNLINTYGTNFTGAYFYEVILENVTGGVTTDLGWILRSINMDCNYCFYQPIQLSFLNRRGSYEYYTFNKDSQRSITTNRNMWMNNLSWDYNIGDRIDNILSQDIEIDYTINSDWVSEYDQNWLEELLSSKSVYVINGTQRIPVVITDTQWTNKTAVRDVLFNVTVKYKYVFPLYQQDE